jgi:hypothetical protein
MTGVKLNRPHFTSCLRRGIKNFPGTTLGYLRRVEKLIGFYFWSFLIAFEPFGPSGEVATHIVGWLSSYVMDHPCQMDSTGSETDAKATAVN